MYPQDSELSQYYHAFSDRLRHGEGIAAVDCRCHGGGWILSDVDTWHQCPDHYVPGTPHPEDTPPTEEELADAGYSSLPGAAEDARTSEAAAHLGSEEDVPF